MFPQEISDILIDVITFGQPGNKPKKRLESFLDFTCDSASLLLNVRKHTSPQSIGKING